MAKKEYTARIHDWYQRYQKVNTGAKNALNSPPKAFLYFFTSGSFYQLIGRNKKTRKC
jgi:hypothetical protein